MLVLFLVQATKAADHILSSPDGTVVLTVSVDQGITYSLSVNGQLLMSGSSLSLTVNDFKTLGQNPKVIREKRQLVNQILKPELKVKSNQIIDNFNELILNFKGNYSVAFRAYNNGIAYQFQTKFKKELTVRSEMATFNFTGNDTMYFPRETEFHSHNERKYELLTLADTDKEDLCSLPILISSSNETKLYISESGLLDYPGMWLRGAEGNVLTAVFPSVALEEKVDHTRWTDDRSTRVSKTADYIAKTKGKRTFPWRIVGVSKNDADLITNQLSYQLAEPSKIADPSWIKPGKVAWDWWNYNNIHGVDFEAGVNTATYKYYIDFASKYGLEYIILDEGWYTLGDVMDVVPNVDVQELTRYGKEKNVGIILWVVWSSLDQKLEEALNAFQTWDVKGIKVDFMQRDDQWMVNYYQRIAEACAQRHIMVDFHGSYKPSGLRRTYPNVMTREGVKGAENHKWENSVTPEHNVTLPFIRMTAGPMDYTPGAMVNAQQENFAAIFNRPMAMGTRCHQLAMYAVFESPLQMLCDSPTNYLREHESTEFISKFPTVWDETKVLQAKVSDYIAVARRSGEHWFVGAMTDNESRSMELDFSFLGEGTYNMEIFEDGTNAHRNGNDYKRRTEQITKGDLLKIQMAPGGGWAARIYK